MINPKRNYDDIINNKRPEPIKKRMSKEDRAAQFASFKALTGYEEEINEVERLTEEKLYLSEEQKEQLNQKLLLLSKSSSPEVSIIYYLDDLKKSGGKYQRVLGKIAKIDIYKRLIIMQDKTIIPMNDIWKIDSKIFKE